MNAWRQLVINLKLCLDWPICFNLKYVKNVHLFKSFSINISIHVWRCTQFVQQIYFDTMDSALSTLIWITGNKVVTFSWNMSKSENISADFPLTKSSRVFDPALTLVHSSCILLPYIILIQCKYSLLRKYSPKNSLFSTWYFINQVCYRKLLDSDLFCVKFLHEVKYMYIALDDLTNECREKAWQLYWLNLFVTDISYLNVSMTRVILVSPSKSPDKVITGTG